MPVLLIPLVVNMMISGAIWISGLPLLLKIILTIITVIKFSLFVAFSFFCEIDWLKKCGVIGCFLFNAFLIIMGIIHNIFGIIFFPSVLIIMFFIWVILPRIIVREERNGSKE